MDVQVISPRSYRESRWSGGVTREIWIYPPDGDYSTRRFKARISSATVDVEESDFTALPGVTRYITPIRGGFTLDRPGKAPKTMGPLDTPYRFDGGEPTHCKGTATDFNLMLKDARGSMEVFRDSAPIRPGICLYFFPAGGPVEGSFGTRILEPDGALLVEAVETDTLSFSGTVICCYVQP